MGPRKDRAPRSPWWRMQASRDEPAPRFPPPGQALSGANYATWFIGSPGFRVEHSPRADPRFLVPIPCRRGHSGWGQCRATRGRAPPRFRASRNTAPQGYLNSEMLWRSDGSTESFTSRSLRYVACSRPGPVRGRCVPDRVGTDGPALAAWRLRRASATVDARAVATRVALAARGAQGAAKGRAPAR